MRRLIPAALACLLLATSASASDGPRSGGLLTGLPAPSLAPQLEKRQPADSGPAQSQPDPETQEAPPEFVVPRHLRPHTRLYARGAGGFTFMQLIGDFDPAAYPNVTPFFPPIGVLEPERAQSDIGFAVGGALGLRIPWAHAPDHAHGATRIEAEYMFRTATLDEVIYEEDFGVRPEADITGRLTGHTVMGNIIAEWWPDEHWRVGGGGGVGVMFTDLKANGREDTGTSVAFQLLGTAETKIADHLWLTFGLTLLGTSEVEYDTDIQEANTLALDFTVGLSLEI
ncbi:MAG: hypothetical protein AAFR96_10280 [Planctomycetota bacterium]